MVKVRTLGQLQDLLDREISWRKKEIATLKASSRGTSNVGQITMVRAGIAITYAHWEGFVKAAANLYLTYVNSLRLTHGEVIDCLCVLSLKGDISGISASKKTGKNVLAYQSIMGAQTERIKIDLSKAIDTESNLKSSVLDNILDSLGIEKTFYQPKYHLIDDQLVKARNGIAHGSDIQMNIDDWRKLADAVIDLINKFKFDLENSASSKEYLRL